MMIVATMIEEATAVTVVIVTNSNWWQNNIKAVPIGAAFFIFIDDDAEVRKYNVNENILQYYN